MPCDIRPDRRELARKILHHSRRRLTQLVPLLLTAVYALEDRIRDTPGPLSTDGTHLWYDPEWVIRDFRADHDAVARQLLHVTLHCLLGHLPLRPSMPSKASFDAAADWKVYEFTTALGIFFALHKGETRPDPLTRVLPYCEPALPAFSAALQNDRERRMALHKKIRSHRLVLDDHHLWHPQTAAAAPQPASAGIGQPDGENGGTSPDWKNMLHDLCLAADRSSQWGHLRGTVAEHFDPTAENALSYEDFLRRFAFPEERLLLDPDSFDPKWYHLGIAHYGDIPLLEPSELSEPPAPNDIVIALDTSGSCSGDICRRFLRETLNLLRDIAAGTRTFRVLLLQCDTEIQQELLLESTDDMDTLAETFAPQGFGGTDFRPVFARIDQLIGDGTLPRVQGLLYLSDSFGRFPAEPPEYPTVFILPPDPCGDPHYSCPSWVTVIQPDDTHATITIKEENL